MPKIRMPGHDQHGHHRTPDEESRRCSRRLRWPLPTLTLVPGASRSWPDGDDLVARLRGRWRRPSRRPRSRVTLMLRSSTVDVGLDDEDILAGRAVLHCGRRRRRSRPSARTSVSTTLTNCPGHSALSTFGNSALSLIVPVVMSAALSMNDSLPRDQRTATELAKPAWTCSIAVGLVFADVGDVLLGHRERRIDRQRSG